MGSNPTDDRREPRDGPRDRRQPRRYTKPALTPYGTLARLTQTGNGTIMEGTISFKMNSCL